MISITILAPFEVPGLQADDSLPVSDNISIHQLLRQSKAPAYVYAFPVLVNGVIVKKRQRLKDGDQVVFIVPISGG